MSPPHTLHEFGGFRLDPSRRALLDPAGASIALKSRVFDTLLYLVEHPGELLDKSAIMKAVWGDVVVEENGLNQNISALRRIFGEAPGENRFIVTVPGRGYQFVAPVRQVAPDSPVRQAAPDAPVRQVASDGTARQVAPDAPVRQAPPDPPVTLRQPPRARLFTPLPWVAGFAMVAVGIATAYALMQRPDPPARRIGAVAGITPLTTYPSDELWPSLSPDGGRVAFTWDGGVGNADIYALQLGAASPVRLTQAVDGEDRNPAWSPDGSLIAFLRLRDPTHLDVFIVPAVGGPERKLASLRVRPISVDGSPLLAWTPDGRTLLVTTQVEGSQSVPVYSFHQLSVETGATTPLALPADDRDYDTSPAFSPDGRRLAFARYRLGQRLAQLMIQELGPGLKPMGKPHAVPGAMGVPHSPHWSPDARQLTFVNGQQILEWDGATVRAVYTLPPKSSGPSESRRIGGLTIAWNGDRARAVAANTDSDSDIWALPLNARTHLAVGPPTRIARSTAFERHPRLSPNGRQLAFISGRSGVPALWIANQDGEGARLLAPLDANVRGYGFPRWSPDGRQIAFHASAPNEERLIYEVDVEAGVPKRLFNGCCPGGWSKDGQYLYVTDAGNVDSIARVRVTTGERERLFVGELAVETVDGQKLLYAKSGTFGIYARSLAGVAGQNPEERLVDDYTPALGAIVPVVDGFFYPGLLRTGQPRAFRFFDYATGVARDVAAAPASVGLGMTVSPDGRELLYSANADESGTDLVLIDFTP